jgi:Na+-translocating ferredoxin:NAD+ oxidoreductase RnfG subunit
MKHQEWTWLSIATLCTSAFATTYYTTEQAQQAIFPGEQLTAAFVKLTDEQAGQIAKITGLSVVRKDIKVWKAAKGGWFFLDEVVGKHERITYAVGLNADGSVRRIEIMDYRESYGFEVRSPAWREQFVGKTAADPVGLDQDIRNISGATLSARHVTDGVKRVLATYAVVLK